MVVSPVVAEHLHKKGIACVEQKTPQALETYEKLLAKAKKLWRFCIWAAKRLTTASAN